MAKTTKKAKQVKPKTGEKPATPGIQAAPAALSPREQAKALLAQKTSLAKWQALYTKVKQIPAAPYNMKSAYEKQTAITHKSLGWGFIVDNRNGRLEVLFQEGIKYLISNYK